LASQKIVIGGGVAQQAHVLPLVHKKVQMILNDYVQSALVKQKIAEYIVLPGLGGRAGVLGAIALAEKAAQAN
ncbi:MAG: ROK family protein, partial [Chloroflexota bacterium]